MNTFRLIAVCIVAALGSLPAVSPAADVGQAVDVAPEVEKTRYQHWPRAAWAEESECWLVVWREGDLNEDETDIWCARISKDGTALDPEGVRITSAKDVQDRPVVASNGKDFLVVWQDLRGGADWDVYAARVSGDGKVLDPDGFVVDARANNQLLPTLVYAGKQYYAAWQSWVEKVMDYGFGSYEVRGTRVSADGTVADPEGTVLAGVTAFQPSLAARDDALVLFLIGRASKKVSQGAPFHNELAFLKIDPEKGTPLGELTYVPSGLRNSTEIHFVPGVALMNDGTTLVTRNAKYGGMRLLHIKKDGTKSDGVQWFRDSRRNQCIAPIACLAGNGEKTLMTYDFPTDKEQIPRPPMRMKVWGWMLSPDGTILDGGKSGFPIAGGKNIDSMQGFPCAGPEGTFLVVYAEARGVENTKTVAKILTPR